MRKSRWFMAIPMILICMLALSGCGQPSPEEVVTEFFDTIVSGDYEGAEEFVEGSDEDKESLFGTKDEATDPDEEATDELVETLFRSIEYDEVAEISVEEDVAKVSVKVTVLDSATIMEKAMSDIMEMVFTDEYTNATEEESDKMINDMLLAAFTDPKAPKVTNVVEVTLNDPGDGWEIVMDDAFMDGITGGLMSFSGE